MTKGKLKIPSVDVKAKRQEKILRKLEEKKLLRKRKTCV